MSLQVWLPLNGNLNNQGCSDVNNITGTNTSFVDGKIGKCCKMGYTSDFTIPAFDKAKQISIAYWCKVNTATSSQWLDMFHFKASDGTNTYWCRQELYSNCTYSGYFADAGGSINAIPCTVGEWIHYAITLNFETGEAKVYRNGILFNQNSNINTSYYILSTNFRLGENGLDLSQNDFRIYDHILSPKEVKEISKGLVLHLPCDGGGRGANNLVNGSNTNSVDTNGFGYSEQTGGSTRTIEYDGGIPCVKITRNTTAHSGWDYFWYNKFRISEIKTGTTYVVSFDAIGSGSGSIGLSGFVNGNGTNTITESVTTVSNSFNANAWSHIQFITKTKSSFDGITVGSQVVYMSCSFLRTVSTWVKLKNMKVTEGATESSWMPSVSDTAYAKMGYDKGVEYDTSGYCNHGIKSGTITYNSDTPRYSVATVFDGTSSGIEIQSSIFPVVLNGPFTISMWVYDQETGGRSIFFGNWNLTGAFFNIEKEGSNKARFYWSGNPDFHCTNSPIVANAWTHLVMTRDGNTVKCYINGVLTDTSTATLSGTVPTNATIFRLGRDGRSDATMFKGCMSDFRLYATVLSADDIKQLYQVSASIDNNGNVFASDIQEV